MFLFLEKNLKFFHHSQLVASLISTQGTMNRRWSAILLLLILIIFPLFVQATGDKEEDKKPTHPRTKSKRSGGKGSRRHDGGGGYVFIPDGNTNKEHSIDGKTLILGATTLILKAILIGQAKEGSGELGAGEFQQSLVGISQSMR